MNPLRIGIWIAALTVSTIGIACEKSSADLAEPTAAQPTTDTSTTSADASGATTPKVWSTVLAGAHRSEPNKARDEFRHPAQTLSFFGVEPTMTVVELSPGRGWYTEVLAPFLHDRGRLIVTIKDPQGPEKYYGTGQAKEILSRIEKEPDVLGKVETVVDPVAVTLDQKGNVEKIAYRPFELASPGTVDMVLTFRSSHGWYERDGIAIAYTGAFEALKPGGVFGIVQHRAPEGGDPVEWAAKGYLPEATVIEVAQSVGFELAEKSEVNANPKDTKDYPEGVWNLPPRLIHKDKDKDKYMAIGESDRMTLKFVKPKG